MTKYLRRDFLGHVADTESNGYIISTLTEGHHESDALFDGELKVKDCDGRANTFYFGTPWPYKSTKDDLISNKEDQEKFLKRMTEKKMHDVYKVDVFIKHLEAYKTFLRNAHDEAYVEFKEWLEKEKNNKKKKATKK